MNHKISRRDFLKWMPIAAGAGLASAYVPRAAPSPASAPSPTPYPCTCSTPTPTPIPPPTPVNASFDVCAFYCQFRENPGDPRDMPGIETITPLYGDRQDPLTIKMDIKWALESGIRTLVMPCTHLHDNAAQRIADWFLPASEPPFDINFGLMFNSLIARVNTSDSSQISVIESNARACNTYLSTMIQHPRYKRLPDGRPVVFYFQAQVVANWFGVDNLEQTVDLLRSNLKEDIFLVGDVMIEPNKVKNNPTFQAPGFVQRMVKAFDGITNYYILRAGYEWHSDQDYNHVVTPFQDMINGYDEACAFWAARAHEYGVKMVPAPMPTGFSNRLLYEAGLDSWLVDRHEGVSYDTAKAMADLGKKYADPDLKMVMISNWNELSEGAAIVPSVGYKFGPLHAVRDTFAIEPSGGWPKDYYLPS